MPKAAPKFTGFDRDAVAFLHELAVEQNREWFAANKARYEQRWVEPMSTLLDELRARIAKAYAPVKLSPPKLFRIYRDTRFAKDKSPYKTHVAGMIYAGTTGAIYLHFGIAEEFVGVGTYFFEDKQVPRWRKLVAADATGKPLAALVGKLRKAGYTVGGHDDYKKVPKGFAPDHPRAEFLKMKGLTAGFPHMPAGTLHRPDLVDWLVGHAKATAPLVVWLARNVK
jgi:uncharacterized protein (TIGR02453 family)